MTTIIETERLILRTWIKEDAGHIFKSTKIPGFRGVFYNLEIHTQKVRAL